MIAKPRCDGWMIANTWFEKRNSHLYTYYSGANKTQIGMITAGISQWGYVMDTKVVRQWHRSTKKWWQH
jgi:hypothetical protein